jgi:serine/threonine protein kinase
LTNSYRLCGYTPFDANTQAEEIQNILKGRYAFEPAEYWEDVSSEAKDFIRKLLVVAPGQRMTPDQALAHGWLNKEVVVPDLMSPITPNTPVDLALMRAQHEAASAFAAAQARGATVEQSRQEAERAAQVVAKEVENVGIKIPERGFAGFAASAPPDVIYAQLMSQATPTTPSAYSTSLGLFSPRDKGINLISKVRHNFNARRSFKKAVEAVKIINKMSDSPHLKDFRPTAQSLDSAKELLQEGVTHLSPMRSSGDQPVQRERSTSPGLGVLPKREEMTPDDAMDES